MSIKINVTLMLWWLYSYLVMVNDTNLFSILGGCDKASLACWVLIYSDIYIVYMYMHA